MPPTDDQPLDFVQLGDTGLQTSALQFGTWRFGKRTESGDLEISEQRAHDLLDTYADAGGRYIDTADVYGGGDSERWIGDWLSDRDRDRYTIASKIYWQVRDGDPNSRGTNRKTIRNRITALLDRLGTEYLDVLYIHRWDGDTTARELMRTLNDLVADGLVHYLGASTLQPNAWRIARANELARAEGWEPFSVLQPRYNLVDREIEGDYLTFAREQGLAVCPWSPLAQGFLTGKYSRDDGLTGESKASDSSRWADTYLTDANFDAHDVLDAVADEVEASPPQVALAWLLHRDGITAPIVGARTPDQLSENIDAATIDLTDDQMARLTDAAAGPYADL
ncbi:MULTISPECIES: aldo/keto reductase [Halobacterium]|uniref:Putative oxidoreductase n=1 Tax=Halobacterium salinarum (strain ATCC 33171 / DSM 3754 / JCM 8978 / NBRC 102687 / NCIMB 764 / 91-R6) TaxID=2597657 RepID=A0A4D6GSU9_HALS9|nr:MULTISPECIES: aldo/keto reductase [Halobacterium]MCF2207349.1 aldo/keto reductase [Halobacterium salinarum]MDL0119400.1 aldo/keto reductase [Halobacterium salinarum]MDL0124680.1 aldo/keto reductase [Halobacterium salinarum]MDL0137356.1 aldo/keto reductase [Halobacterium salinarum]MDL0142726.1 aldo/keto reductase [Halobacterium salinarum]